MHLFHRPVLVAEHAGFSVHAVLFLVIEELPAVPTLELDAIAGDSCSGELLLRVGERALVFLVTLSGVDPTLA